MKQPTSLEVIQQVLGQLGLPVPTVVAASVGDVTAQQMQRLLTWCGRQLIKPTSGWRWTALLRTWTLVTIPAQTQYDMPSDWDSFEDLTGWNMSARLPLLGPALDAQWNALLARGLGPSTISIVYRTRGSKFELYAAPSQPQTLIIDYSSRGWVRDANASPTEYRDFIEKDDDVILYDNELIEAKLKLAFLTAKGFDTTAAQGEYNGLEEAAICADQDAPVLSATYSATYPLINTNYNLPDTGYGV